LGQKKKQVIFGLGSDGPLHQLRYECPMVLIAQIALGVIIATAQAAEPTGTLMLACQGKILDINEDTTRVG
jgi:hypothetical protein